MPERYLLENPELFDRLARAVDEREHRKLTYLSDVRPVVVLADATEGPYRVNGFGWHAGSIQGPVAGVISQVMLKNAGRCTLSLDRVWVVNDSGATQTVAILRGVSPAAADIPFNIAVDTTEALSAPTGEILVGSQAAALPAVRVFMAVTHLTPTSAAHASAEFVGPWFLRPGERVLLHLGAVNVGMEWAMAGRYWNDQARTGRA